MTTPRTLLAGSAIGSLAVLALGAAVTTGSSSPSPSAGLAWTYVAVGDSLLYALEADCDGCTSAAVLFGERITAGTGVPVDVHNLTMHDGSSSATLLEHIRGDHDIGRAPEPARAAIAGADIVSVTIGFNDTLSDGLLEEFYAGTCGGPDNSDCFFDTIPTLEANLDAIMAEIDTLRAGRPTMVRVTNLYNNGIPEPGMPEPWDNPPGYGASVLRDLTEAQNEAICRVAAEHAAECVDLYHAFNGADGTSSSFPLLGSDMTHPNQLGMDVIADALADEGYAPLR